MPLSRKAFWDGGIPAFPSIESGTRIYDERARESLSQYIVRAPVSLEKITWDSVSRSDRSRASLVRELPANRHCNLKSASHRAAQGQGKVLRRPGFHCATQSAYSGKGEVFAQKVWGILLPKPRDVEESSGAADAGGRKLVWLG
jgi:hypothetical protein